MLETTPNSSPNSIGHDTSASRKRQRDLQSVETDTPTKAARRTRSPVPDRGKSAARNERMKPRDPTPLEVDAKCDTRQDIQAPKMPETPEQHSSNLATALIKESGPESFTKGLPRIVLVEDGGAKVVALLPDSRMMSVLNLAANYERTLRQAIARAPLQRQRLRDFQARKVQLSNRIMELAEQHELISDSLISLSETMQGEVMEADMAMNSIENHLADQEHDARYYQSGLARVLEKLFVECQYFEEATELGDASEWAQEFDQKYGLSDSHLSIEDEVEKILKDQSIELPEESGSPDTATQNADPPRERDREAESEQEKACSRYHTACRDHREAEEALEQYTENPSGALRRHSATGEVPEDSLDDAGHQHFREVQRLTADIYAAEVGWILARKDAQNLGVDVGFSEDGFDYSCEDDLEPILPPGDFPERRHNPELEPARWWHDALPKHAVTRAMSRQDGENSSLNDVHTQSAEEGFGAGTSAIEDSPHRRHLIMEWKAHCEKLRMEIEHQS